MIVTWTGNLGEGTASYTAYSRGHDVTGEAKPTIPGTADPAFRGDATRWNPEELLVASLSQCHMLEFLAQAAWPTLWSPDTSTSRVGPWSRPVTVGRLWR